MAEAPTLDGVADEAFWADAAPLSVKVAHGANTEKNEVTLKSVYTDDMIYFLVSWPDTTESFVRSRPQPILWLSVYRQLSQRSVQFMILTSKELWGLIHGMVLGGLFLLTFAGGLAGLYSLRPEWVTVTGMQERLRRLDFGTIAMAVVAWLTCITGTFIVYTWYRAAPPDGTTGDALRAFPRYFLLANEGLKEWHAFGMGWKEHVAWFAPLLATAVAYIVWRYRGQLAGNAALRNIVIGVFLLAFADAAVAGLMGALITKAEPLL